MSNIFISHSSHDKPFVRRLATALVSEGFPVWLDSWKLELGDSLLDKIYDGIDASSIVLLVTSKSSHESGWVNKELNAALSKEHAIGRKFVIPLRIDDSELPLKIADRLYGDFSVSFSEPLSVLVDILEKSGGRLVAPKPDRELIAISFSREVHLNTAGLSSTMRHIGSRQGACTISASQVVANDDPEYIALRRRLHVRIDKVTDDPYFSQNLERALRNALESVRRTEKTLATGIASMLSNGCSHEAIYWFAKIVRGRAVYELWSAQIPEAPDLLTYGRSWSSSSLLSNSAAAEFFETSAVEPVALWGDGMHASDHFSIWIGEQEIQRIRSDEGVYYGPDSLVRVCNYSAIDKFVFPQLVLQNLERGTPPIPWNLDNATVGIR
jgi:TIR domain